MKKIVGLAGVGLFLTWTNDCATRNQTHQSIRLPGEEFSVTAKSLPNVSPNVMRVKTGEKMAIQTRTVALAPRKKISRQLLEKSKSMAAGDTLQFRGHTLVKVDLEDVPDPSEGRRLLVEWRQEVRRFLQAEVREDSLAFAEYLEAQHHFDRYDSEIAPFVEEVTREFGSEFAIALDGEFKELFDSSNHAYEKRLSLIFGEEILKRFNEMETQYRQRAYTSGYRATLGVIR